MAKTVVIWDSCDGDICFFVTDKDVSHLDNKYVNSNTTEQEGTEISLLMYDSDGNKVIKTTKEFPVQEVRDGASVVVTGFVL